ncbi:MAG TPA: SMI1/KNR4 family protein [Urbifossiella sp.]|nr:SMI1/KNR4 family protein [Urbifossiella sp.]
MTPRELAKALRRAHRDRYGEAADRPDPDDAEAALAEAEEVLGFRPPKLVRAVYAHAGPDFIDLPFGVEKYAERYSADKAPGDPGYWPARMLPVKNLAEETDWLCVDCAAGAGAVFAYYDDWDSGEPCWPGMFVPVAASLEEFLLGVVGGGDFPPGRADPGDPAGRP